MKKNIYIENTESQFAIAVLVSIRVRYSLFTVYFREIHVT